jgi:GT2 family glycosyltransferase
MSISDVQNYMPITDLSIVIVSYNTKELLKNCIKSIYETVKNPSYEIIIVDNASSDGSPELVEREFNDIVLIKNKENLGFAKANNQAIELAKGKYLLLLNSDAILREGTVETLLDFIERHPDAAAVGPKVLGIEESLQNKGFLFPSVMFSLLVLSGINKFLDEKMKCRIFPKYYWNENDVREVDYLEGSCLLVKREGIDMVGLLPEVYFMYFEEAEWCYRAKKKGFKIWYVPVAQIIHLHASSSFESRKEYYDRSLLLFYKRNIGTVKGSVIAALMISASCIDFVICSLLEPDNMKLGKIRDQLKQQTRLLKGLFGLDRMSKMGA